jgi:lipopolysaccharide biosynthesis regulator YciM
MSTELDRCGNYPYSLPESIIEALNKSERELLRLATYYHQFGYFDKAEEIYKTILKVNRRGAQRDDKA